MDIATMDYLLTTTRVVRRRLDLSRPVEPEVLERCLMIYAPAGFEEYFSEVTEATKNAPGGPVDYENTLPTIRRIQDKYGMRRRG